MTYAISFTLYPCSLFHFYLLGAIGVQFLLYTRITPLKFHFNYHFYCIIIGNNFISTTTNPSSIDCWKLASLLQSAIQREEGNGVLTSYLLEFLKFLPRKIKVKIIIKNFIVNNFVSTCRTKMQ